MQLKEVINRGCAQIHADGPNGTIRRQPVSWREGGQDSAIGMDHLRESARIRG